MRNKTMHEAGNASSSHLRYDTVMRVGFTFSTHCIWRWKCLRAAREAQVLKKKKKSFNTPAEFISIDPKHS